MSIGKLFFPVMLFREKLIRKDKSINYKSKNEKDNKVLIKLDQFS
jgi:hypothetical protein